MNTIKFPTELIEAINKLEPSMRCQIYDSVVHYVSTGEMPSEMSPVVCAIITLARPMIDRANRKPKTKAEVIKSPEAAKPMPESASQPSAEDYCKEFVESDVAVSLKRLLNEKMIYPENIEELYRKATDAGVLDEVHKLPLDDWRGKVKPILYRYACKACR